MRIKRRHMHPLAPARTPGLCHKHVTILAPTKLRLRPGGVLLTKKALLSLGNKISSLNPEHTPKSHEHWLRLLEEAPRSAGVSCREDEHAELKASTLGTAPASLLSRLYISHKSPLGRTARRYCTFAYSALASFRRGMWGRRPSKENRCGQTCTGVLMWHNQKGPFQANEVMSSSISIRYVS
jgi:hypothetical protein